MRDDFFDDSDDNDCEHEDGIDYSEMAGFSVFMRTQWSTYFGPEWEGGGPKFARGMYGKNGQLAIMGAFLAKGCSIRETQRLSGGSRNTVIKMHRVLIAITGKPFLCACGKPSTHQGWCVPRYKLSDMRQAFMRVWHAEQVARRRGKRG